MNQDSPTTSATTLLLCFFAGAAAGAAAVALTTRRTGPELRGDLKDYARRARERASDLAADAAGAWDGMKERTQAAAEDIGRGFKDAAKDLRS